MATNILDNIDLRALGELLRQVREKCSMTQAHAAKVIDVACTTVVAIEKGERRIKATELIKLARAYGRSISDFVSSPPIVQPYQHLAIEALDQGLITEGRFADFLNVDRLEARRIAEVLLEHSSGMIEETTHVDLRQIQE